MCGPTRRRLIAAVIGAAVPVPAHATERRDFVAAAFRMREEAVAAGDQPYGAVVVRAGEVVGWGPSRVRQRGDWVGHAEREAMRDAQSRLARHDLSDCVMYSTSHPCAACRRAAREAGLARMYHGADATDAGSP
jgi:guanine deaminase